MHTAMTETILAAVSEEELTVDPIERSETVPSHGMRDLCSIIMADNK